MLVGTYVLGLIFVAIIKGIAGFMAAGAGVAVGIYDDIRYWLAHRSN